MKKVQTKLGINFSLKTFSLLLLLLFSFTFISAIETHAQNQDFFFSFNSNNATSWNLTTMNTPSGIVNLDFETSKVGQEFSFSVNSGNFTQLGVYCINLIGTDGVNSISRELCRQVTPSGQQVNNSNIFFFLFVIFLIYTITFIGFFGRNIPITVLGGMAMLFLGVYMVNNGIIIYRDALTNYVAYLTMGVGAIMSFWALLEQFDLI